MYGHIDKYPKANRRKPASWSVLRASENIRKGFRPYTSDSEIEHAVLWSMVVIEQQLSWEFVFTFLRFVRSQILSCLPVDKATCQLSTEFD